eukprot:CAMPEP_0185780280 /NCGR_PEP_ID=MMETSP1174-20130828/98606_1 /TAXON_ID=35687 /ORGANISM="Dictyocha speculum, Strain CCMP1381" /LENGTH=384 /DNA_ID=CAMNT_0028469783 /DNA_START=184 /DNA_END=1338 /DNA_ORIENTATION=+
MEGRDTSSDDFTGSCRPVSSFERKNRIGEGTYGTVYRAVDKHTSEVVALKKVILHNEKQVGFPITSLREVRLLKRLNHPNCVLLREVAVGKNRDAVFLVMEYCEHDMASLIDNMCTRFSESEVKGLMVQLLRAVGYLHDNWIIHRDLKMSNLLYNNRGQLKVADFGLARLYGSPLKPMTPKVVTLWYRAPELLLGSETYGPMVDIWAVGCILGELIDHKPLMPGRKEADQIDCIFRLLGCPDETCWPGLSQLALIQRGQVNLERHRYRTSTLSERLDFWTDIGVQFLSGLLVYDPSSRLTARGALGHEYFNSRPYAQQPDLMPTFPTQHLSTQDETGATISTNSQRTERKDTAAVIDTSRPVPRTVQKPKMRSNEGDAKRRRSA